MKNTSSKRDEKLLLLLILFYKDFLLGKEKKYVLYLSIVHVRLLCHRIVLFFDYDFDQNNNKIQQQTHREREKIITFFYNSKMKTLDFKRKMTAAFSNAREDDIRPVINYLSYKMKSNSLKQIYSISNILNVKQSISNNRILIAFRLDFIKRFSR